MLPLCDLRFIANKVYVMLLCYDKQNHALRGTIQQHTQLYYRITSSLASVTFNHRLGHSSCQWKPDFKQMFQQIHSVHIVLQLVRHDLIMGLLVLCISELLWLCRVVALKSLPVHLFNALITPILRGCLQSLQKLRARLGSRKTGLSPPVF